MPVITKRWEVASPPLPEALNELSGYPPILQLILYNRGYTSHEQARQFLAAQIPPGCQPENLLNLPSALDRINQAISNQEKIVVYGDYDADGVTATALLGTALKSIGAEVKEYIPNRFDEGYGLNLDAIRLLSQDNAKLIITVDCGIRSWDEAELARSLGIDLIITDHHNPLDDLPDAFAIINPKQSGDTYPEKNLSGVGLAYKIVEGLALSGIHTQLDARNYLDLVAIGTVADLVPLTGENRALVRAGLEDIRHPHRQGIMGLIGVSQLVPAHITATDIGFVFGPRLNAAGRLESAMNSLNLLTSQDTNEIGKLAQELEIQNRKRQVVMRSIQEKAEQLAFLREENPYILIAVDPDFNPGVVGLAASKLTEQYYRPSIIASQGDAFTRASCRSIPEFHITQALDLYKDLLEHHGGHAAAAGFTVRNENLPDLISKMQTLAEEQLADKDLRPKIHADAEISLSDLSFDLLKHLEYLQPTGMGNPEPVFMSRGINVVSQKVVGAEGAHLKLVVTDGRSLFDAIAFRQGHWLTRLPDTIDIMYTFGRNEFNGRVSLQLNVKDIRAAEV